MAQSIDDVIDQMRLRDIEPPPSGLAADGKKVTWAGDARRPKKKNAWCVLHEWISPKSGRSFVVGVYGIRDQHWTVEPTQMEWSPAEKTAWLERRKALEKDAELDRRQQSEAASAKAARLWERSRLDGASDYLQRKQVGAYGVRFAFGSVVVPLVDLAGKLHGLQWIGKDGAKVFGTGTAKEGHFHLVGEVADGRPVAFAEGYATAASVHMATAWPTVACFDAGNLLTVIAAWRKLYPEHEFIVAGDDDRHLVRRLCERLEQAGISAKPADFGRSAGGLRDMRWDLPDGSAVSLKARWAKDRADVYYIEGSIEVGGVAHMLRLENAGRAKAFAAAKKHGARVILPRFEDRASGATDWNDLHVAEGIKAVRQQLLAPPPAPEAKKSSALPRGFGGGDDGVPGRLRFPFVTDKWEIKGIRENVYFALREDPLLHDLVRFNEFSKKIDKMRVPLWGGNAGEWKEVLDDIRLAQYLADQHGLIVGNPITIEQAVLMAAYDNIYNPVREDMEAIPWDGVRRSAHWMVDCLGAVDTEYVRRVSVYFLRNIIARVFDPGCQMDYMLVLQGSQGQGKSSVLKLLGGDYYGAGSFRLGDKDGLQALQGCLLYNYNELDGYSRAESTALKGFITERTDRFRPPYAKGFQKFPRNCVLTGDTNQGEFLRDATGDRRFWVIHCELIDVDRMRETRAQLLAEALHDYRAGEPRFPDREEERTLFFPEQERWKFVDVWADALARYVNSSECVEGFDGCVSDSGAMLENCDREFFSTHELLTRGLHIDVGKIDRAGTMQKSVGNAMKALGFDQYKWPKGRNRPRGYLRSLGDAKNVLAGVSRAANAQSVVNEVPTWQ